MTRSSKGGPVAGTTFTRKAGMEQLRVQGGKKMGGRKMVQSNRHSHFCP
jgi:hypothetical protein